MLRGGVASWQVTLRLPSCSLVDAAISADSGATHGERDGPAAGGDTELEGDKLLDLLLALLPTLTVHWPPHWLSPSMTGDIDGRAAPSCRRSSCPRSGSGVDGLDGMSGDVLPPAGGGTTATHGDVISSPMVGRKFLWGRQGGVVYLPTPPMKPVDMIGLPQVVVVTVQVVRVVGSDVAGEMGGSISPGLPDGLPLVIWGRLGNLAGSDVLDWLVLMPLANGDVELPVPLGDGLPRVVRRAAVALFSTGAQVGRPAVMTTPTLDVVLGGGPCLLES